MSRAPLYTVLPMGTVRTSRPIQIVAGGQGRAAHELWRTAREMGWCFLAALPVAVLWVVLLTLRII